MKAKSRRRLLISSVAMLLVAMLALGTATFAWFTTSTSTKADGINVTTVKSSNLKISRWDHDWKDGFSYGHTSASYKPASSADGATWYTAVALEKNNYAKTGDFTSVGTPTTNAAGTSTGIANLVFMDEINVKNEGDIAATNVTITISGTFSDYVRVAVVPSNEDHEITAANFRANVYGKDTTAYTPAPGTGDPVPTITPKTERVINVSSSMAKGDCAYYRVFVWFEGQDTDCYDLNGGQSLPNLEFQVSGTTGQQ